MDWVISEHKVPQIFYNTYREPIEVLHKFLVCKTIIPNGLTDVKNHTTLLSKAETIVVRRATALGDLLIVSAVVQKVKKRNQKFILVCQRRHLESGILQKLNVWDWLISLENIYTIPSNKYDVGIDLDSVFEQDHYSPKWQIVPRVKIAMDCFGLKENPDWVFDGVFTKSNEVVIQTSGSFPHKELPRGTINQLIDKINQLGFTPIEIGRDNKLPGVDYFNIIGSAFAVITMDSSPLWISHFTKTRTILILGPTGKEQRLLKHPLEPEYAKAIELSYLVGCKPCFEMFGGCRGEFDCLKIDSKIIVDRVGEILEGWRDERP